MSLAFDERIMRITLQVRGGKKSFEQPLSLKASGQLHGSPQANEASVVITNMSAQDRDYILSTYSIWRQGMAKGTCIIEAGRVSTGLAKVFQGVIVESSPGQPPDIGVGLKILEGFYGATTAMSVSAPAQASFQGIAAMVAKNLGLNLRFEATDRQVSNFSVSGSAKAQIEALAATGAQVFQDGDTLVVKSSPSIPLKGGQRVVSADSGMIGIPEMTELGVRVKMLWTPGIRLGQSIHVESKLNPAATGAYTVYDLAFDLATREEPWYWTASCTRQNFLRGTI